MSSAETFLSWLAGEPRHAHLYGHLRRNPGTLKQILRELQADAPAVATRGGRTGADPGEWTIARRSKANLEALARYESLRSTGRPLTPEDRKVLLTYSGWGGIDPATLTSTPELPLDVQEAIDDWKEAVAERRPPRKGVFRGLLDQFFTPLSACRAMWSLAQRALGGRTVQYALEPSAGIGRFLQAAPDAQDGINWTLVERDPLLASFAQVVWPDAQVVQDLFERYAVHVLGQAGRFDLVLMNPPYGDWTSIGKQADPAAARIVGDLQSYFLLRGIEVLAPGGVLISLSTAGQMTGGSEENRRLRTNVLRSAHLAGAALVGTDMFARSGAAPAAGLCISVWVRLPEGGRQTLGITPRDQAIIAGGYFRTPEGEASVLGTWGVGRYGDPVVQGPFDEAATARIPLVGLPAGILPEGVAATRVDTHTKKGGRREGPAPASLVQGLRDAREELPAFELRLARYYTLYEGTPAERELAHAGREELYRDLREFLNAVGAPTADWPAGWIQRVVSSTGEIHASLAQGDVAATRPTERPPTPAEAVRWYSRMTGQCTEGDLLREYPDADLITTVLSEDDLAIEVLPAGSAGYDQRDYLSGNLYERLDRAKKLAQSPDGALAARAEAQQGWLMEVIAPRTIVQIDARPNSGFVPPEAVSAFCNELYLNPSKGEPVRGTVTAQVQIWKEGARYSVDTRGALVRDDKIYGRNDKSIAKEVVEDRKRRLMFLLGYLNRENEVADPDEKEAKLYRRYKSDDPDERKAEDVALEQSFNLWLAQNDTWRPVIEDSYNRMFRSDRLREYAATPLPLMRRAPARVPHGHQWIAARRMEDRGNVLLNWAVGAGKTIGALTTLAWLRQQGKARRILVVMPNPILFTWILEAARFLPDYRVGTIGITYDAKRKMYRTDTGREEERASKWERFAAGGYDVLFCVASAFTRDIVVDPHTMQDILGQVEWIMRGFGKDAEQRRLLERRKEDAEKDVLKQNAELVKEKDVREQARLRAKIQVLKEQIAKWDKDLKLPSKTVMAKIQQMVEDNINSGLFRPSDVNGPVPGIVDWNSLGVDLLIVDEAHNYKNLYAPAGRYGAESIAYMGARKWSDDWTDFTITAWDMYVKTQALLERTGGTGVMLLTATPVKNSPLEVYNVFAYMSKHVWASRGVESGEAWIDRYVELQPHTYPTVDGQLRTDLSVTGFNEANLEELHGVFSVWMYRLTIKDLVAAGLIAADAVPEGVEVPADVRMDATQIGIYKRIKELVHVEEKIAEIAKMTTPGAVRLLRMDLAKKAALDPRLLVEDIEKVARILVMDEWLAAGGKTPPDVHVEYTLPEIEDEDAATACQEVLDHFRVIQEADIDGSKLTGLKKPQEKKRGLSEVQRANMGRRYLFLLSLNLDRVNYSESEGAIPPKYQELIGNVQAAMHANQCGHLIFSDYQSTHAWIADALVTIAGVPRERIAMLTAAVTPADRDQIATDFNGSRRTVNPATGAVLTEEQAPKYDILIGNEVMEEGLNLQTRTCGIHHLTLPWDPATLQQRNGRGVRQGNTLDEVMVRLYIALGSLDIKVKDVILGKASWMESLLSGASAGSIELDSDWNDLMVTEFAINPEEAQALLAKNRVEQERRVRGRLIREVSRDLRTAVALYDRARHSSIPAERAAQAGIADRTIQALRNKCQRIGMPQEVLARAKTRTVWAVPSTGLWLAEGEDVSLRSDATNDGVYHTEPKALRIVRIPVSWAFLTVREWGSPHAYMVTLPTAAGGESVAPALLLDPGSHGAVHLQGTIQRVGKAPWDADAEWKIVLPKLVKAGAPGLAEWPTGHITASEFRTRARVQEVWEATFSGNAIMDQYTLSAWFGRVPDVYGRGSSRLEGVPLVHPDGRVLIVAGGFIHDYLFAKDMQALRAAFLEWRPLAPTDPADAAVFDQATPERLHFSSNRDPVRPGQAAWGPTLSAGRMWTAPMKAELIGDVRQFWFGSRGSLRRVRTR